MQPNIHDWVTGEISKFETQEIQVADNWWWSLRKHVQMIFHLKNGVFYTGSNDWLRAFQNIMDPILNLAYWTEDIEVKDVVFFIESAKGKVLSFFVKKYHDEVYTREHDLDTLFDEITESDLDYGGVIVQEGTEMPEVLPLNSIVFCDQTDLLGGPIGFRYFFSPDKLRSMKKHGWGEDKNGATISIDDLCILATAEKTSGSQGENKNQVSGKTIEVIIVRGTMPDHYLNDSDDMENHCGQIQIIAFYTDSEKNRQSVTLYRKKEEDSSLMFFTSKKVYQRGLGRGVGETILGPQIWTNFLTIHKTNMLEAGSKVPLYTDDSSYTTKNKIQDMETLEITTIEDGKQIRPVPTMATANVQLFASEINQWWAFAQTAGAANDPIMGKEAVSGTTFRGQERTVAQGKGLHDRRRGQRAKFIELLYRKFILPDIKKDILKGKKFLAKLSTEELQWVAEQLAICEVNKIIKKREISGKKFTKEEQDLLTQEKKQEILRKGDKHLLEILKGEFEDVEIEIGINVAGKQRDLAMLSDKLLSIFQFVFANPQAFQTAMQQPALAKAFENILEYGNMSIANFSTLLQAPVVSPIQQPEVTAEASPQIAYNQPQS